ncbi:MAG: hypothetical protein J6Z49_00420, partial [Kiritimatiellae bacterium]|nr:hypothetical protein [Kiritimatiellia bacterium]
MYMNLVARANPTVFTVSLRFNNTPSADVKNLNVERTDRTVRGSIHGDRWHFIGKPAARAPHGNVDVDNFF